VKPMVNMRLVWTPDTPFPTLADSLLAAVEKGDFTKEDMLFAFMALRSTVIQLDMDIGGEPTQEAEAPIPQEASGDVAILLRAVEICMGAVGIVQQQSDFLNKGLARTSQALEEYIDFSHENRAALLNLGGKIPE